jgi:MFS family permease
MSWGRSAGGLVSGPSAPTANGQRESKHWWDETWRRNLAIVWIASILGSAALTFVAPFLPLFLSRDLGITDPSELAFWTGVITASNGFTLIFASPIWGTVADRYGRKPMLMRALAGSGFFVGLMAFCQTPWQVAASRFGLGAVTGILPTGNAMIAAQTPRAHVGWALGMITAAFSIGSATGPAIAGVLSGMIGLRGVFIAGGAMLVTVALLVVLVMREQRIDRQAPRPNVLRELRAMPRATAMAIVVLLACQCFLWMSLQSAQPMFALRILELRRVDVATVTGIAFACFGLASMVASISYSRLLRRFGFRRMAYVGIAAAGLSMITAALTSAIPVLISAMALTGLSSGTLQPVVSSMLGLETPPPLVGTVFGFSNSALAIGLSVGPLVIGTLAAAHGTSLGLSLAAAPLIVMGVALLAVRDPGI